MAIIGGDQGKAGESKGSGRKADDLRLSCLCLLLFWGICHPWPLPMSPLHHRGFLPAVSQMNSSPNFKSNSSTQAILNNEIVLMFSPVSISSILVQAPHYAYLWGSIRVFTIRLQTSVVGRNSMISAWYFLQRGGGGHTVTLQIMHSKPFPSWCQ